MSDATAMTRGFTQEAFDALLDTRGEPDWLRSLRCEAWRAFQEMPMPARNEEEWMRTDIRPLKLDEFSLPAAESECPAAPELLSEGVQLGGAAKTVNGANRDSSLSDKWRQKGVLFGNLSDFVRSDGELVRRHLYQGTLHAGLDRLAALHAACWTSGTFLYVPRNVVVDEPFYSQSTVTENGVDLGHTLVVLEEGAEVTYLSEMQSCQSTDSGLHCGGTEVYVGDRARLRFVNLQDWGHNVWHFAHQHARLGRDASLQWTVGALGSRLAKVNQQVALAGKGADCQVNGVMFTEGRQHLSYHTLQHHQAESCRSDFLYKAALQDKSRTVWRGMIKVDRNAQKTDGYQRNDNLLLSNQCRADAIPGLEIEADDVRCTHGATTGRVDDELLFYAQSRGFTRKEAVRLVVSGFFQQVFDRITIESVREALGQAIGRRVREVR